MLVCQQSNLIEVRRLDNRGRGGRGVFASVDILPGTLIERVPVILIPEAQVFGDSPLAKRSARISWYVFGRENLTNRNYVALALGYGSIYNHSFKPNARYGPIAPDLMEFYSLRLISAREEITINYNGDPNDNRELDFDVH
jgi:uncharacterized protein